MMVSARNARKTPLPATWNKKAAPSPPPPPLPPRGTDTRSAMPRSTGRPMSTASRSRLRHRRKIRPSSERSIRNHGRTTPCRTGPPATGATPPGRGGASAVDIETLPGELHEQVFQAGPRRIEGGHGNVGQHQGTVHRFRRVLTDLRADLAVAGLDVRQPQRLQHARRPSWVGGPNLDPGRAARPHLLQRALEDQPARPHHPHVAADLL